MRGGGVGGVSRGGGVPGPRGPARPAAGFPVGARADRAAAGGATAAPATAAVGLSLLAVQENGGRRWRDAAARRRAEAMLDELRGLQAELLGGRPDSARLARLAGLQAGEDGADPELREAVRAVSLRAQVELARRARDTAGD